MTKKVLKIVPIICLVLALSAGTFAKSIYFSTSVKPEGTPVFPLAVETPQVVIDWFEKQGLAVDSYSSDINQMPVDYRDEICDLYEDNKDELDAIAQKVLIPYLEEGSVEHVTTGYGPISWIVQYNN